MQRIKDRKRKQIKNIKSTKIINVKGGRKRTTDVKGDLRNCNNQCR